MSDALNTCSDSLLNPGICCAADCDDPATVAVLTLDDALAGTEGGRLVEHARCGIHATGPDVVAVKPLDWSPLWGGA